MALELDSAFKKIKITFYFSAFLFLVSTETLKSFETKLTAHPLEGQDNCLFASRRKVDKNIPDIKRCCANLVFTFPKDWSAIHYKPL